MPSGKNRCGRMKDPWWWWNHRPQPTKTGAQQDSSWWATQDWEEPGNRWWWPKPEWEIVAWPLCSPLEDVPCLRQETLLQNGHSSETEDLVEDIDLIEDAIEDLVRAHFKEVYIDFLLEVYEDRKTEAWQSNTRELECELCGKVFTALPQCVDHIFAARHLKSMKLGLKRDVLHRMGCDVRAAMQQSRGGVKKSLERNRIPEGAPRLANSEQSDDVRLFTEI